MSFNSSIIVISIIATIISLIISLLFTKLTKFSQSKKYNYEEKYALIESQRNFYEKQIYELSKRLSSLNNERWLDLNKMLLLAQENKSKEINNKIIINNFLKNCGITEENLDIDSKLVFIIIPLNKVFSSLHKSIKKICSENNLEAIKSDEEYIEGDILNHIVKLIVKSRFIIAVLDGRNANVYYELGIAHALGKDVILLSSAEEYLDMPFNIKSNDIAFYNSTKTLSIELNDRIKKMLIRT